MPSKNGRPGICPGRAQEKCGFHHYAFGKYETQLGTVEEDEMTVLYQEEYKKG